MMKIMGIPSQSIQTYKAKARIAPAAGQKPGFGKDQIEVSGEAMLFSEAMRAAKAAMAQPAGQARLATLAQSMENGTYPLGEDMLAGSILSMEI